MKRTLIYIVKGMRTLKNEVDYRIFEWNDQIIFHEIADLYKMYL